MANIIIVAVAENGSLPASESVYTNYTLLYYTAPHHYTYECLTTCCTHCAIFTAQSPGSHRTLPWKTASNYQDNYAPNPLTTELQTHRSHPSPYSRPQLIPTSLQRAIIGPLNTKQLPGTGDSISISIPISRAVHACSNHPRTQPSTPTTAPKTRTMGSHARMMHNSCHRHMPPTQRKAAIASPNSQGKNADHGRLVIAATHYDVNNARLDPEQRVTRDAVNAPHCCPSLN